MLANSKYSGSFLYAVIILIFTLCLLLVCSNDGWLRMEYPRMDSAWFFMAGKSWMSGLTPYVDFADSKGPLLWLIYGIGYLLSPTSMHGVFWMEVAFYFGTFYFLFLAARIFLRGEGVALLASFLMAFAFFQPWIHYEIRAEDYCNLFNAITLYSIANIIVAGRRRNGDFIQLGVSFAGALLIKYNMALMLLAPGGVALIFVWWRYGFRAFLYGFVSWIAGVLILTLPFLIYFLLTGSFMTFVNEYFLITPKTITSQHFQWGERFYQNWPFEIFDHLEEKTLNRFMTIKLALLSMLFTCFKLFRTNWFRGAVWLWFVAAYLLSTYISFPYYVNSLAIFFIFIILVLLSWVPRIPTSLSILCGGVVVALVGLALTFMKKGEFYDVESAEMIKRGNDVITRVIADYGRRKGEAPTIVYAITYDNGLHIKSGAMPGEKYWSLQAGSTPEMRREHEELVFELRPDFVTVPAEFEYYVDRLEGSGYNRIYEYYPSDFARTGNDIHYLYQNTAR